MLRLYVHLSYLLLYTTHDPQYTVHILTSISQKHSDLPVQFAAGKEPLEASIVLGGFGASAGLDKPFFTVSLTRDANAKPVAYEAPLRYGKQPEIQHTYKAEPTSPPKLISAAFAVAVAAAVPALLVGVCTFYYYQYLLLFRLGEVTEMV